MSYLEKYVKLAKVKVRTVSGYEVEGQLIDCGRDFVVVTKGSSTFVFLLDNVELIEKK